MKSITRLSLALIMFSLFPISYLLTSVSAQSGMPPMNNNSGMGTMNNNSGMGTMNNNSGMGTMGNHSGM
jgi:hypothetical protein